MIFAADRTELGYIFMSGGANGFGGEGYRHHKLFPLIPGTSAKGGTHCTKTLTLVPRMPTYQSKGQGQGNLVLNEKTLQPEDIFPDCINLDFFTGEIANCVSLSNPGIEAYLERGVIQNFIDPVVITYTPVAGNKESRLDETRQFARKIKARQHQFRGRIVICLSFCPNTGHCYWQEFLDELIGHLEIFSQELGAPTIIKINPLFPISDLLIVERTGLCTAAEASNAIPFGAFRDKIDWERYRYLTYPVVSRYGTCGLSSPVGFELSKGYIYNARFAGSKMQFICGGLDCVRQVREAALAGANAVAISRARITRFWRTSDIVFEARRYFGGGSWKPTKWERARIIGQKIIAGALTRISKKMSGGSDGK